LTLDNDNFDLNKDNDERGAAYTDTISNTLLDAKDPGGVYKCLGLDLFQNLKFYWDLALFGLVLLTFT
jgi:hypothetical protein